MQFLSTKLARGVEDDVVALSIRSLEQNDAFLRQWCCDQRIQFSSHEAQAKADEELSVQKAYL